MHGLFNRSLQRFLVATYGCDMWDQVVRVADLDAPEFEALLTYPDKVTGDVLCAAARILGKPAEDILEDLGTFLVSNAPSDAVRRLLRFGGADFNTFLLSLPDLPDRARLAIPNLDLPRFRLEERENDLFTLECTTRYPEFCHVTLGALRAMADDYGVLVSLDLALQPGKGACISIRIYEACHHEGRNFSLGLRSP